MRFGGNTRARAALADVQDEKDLRRKYESEQAEEYRKKLKAEVHNELGLPLEEPPVSRSPAPSNGAVSDPRFRGATAISSHEYYGNGRHPNRPNDDDSGTCPCTIL